MMWLSMTSVSDMGQKTEHLELFCSVFFKRGGVYGKFHHLKEIFCIFL
ncbi:unnamed protein product [Photorhabdus laumondii subsp. laumondii TTO1]|uniref:Photorhabdus luminescens subsp. laumondii TTO1 complete genome segment 13/17 n=1 Tax=Photorhabdus laumondii subsp. laumondii (strain DSM 15139 / CIP 105565 / TT01) TaxID=243265 RepID=Q7N166_PHOLL|nr:unnamed protein product [Photorhabdus laumondii subsp. laumondii TTO1]